MARTSTRRLARAHSTRRGRRPGVRDRHGMRATHADFGGRVVAGRNLAPSPTRSSTRRTSTTASRRPRDARRRDRRRQRRTASRSRRAVVPVASSGRSGASVDPHRDIGSRDQHRRGVEVGAKSRQSAGSRATASCVPGAECGSAFVDGHRHQHHHQPDEDDARSTGRRCARAGLDASARRWAVGRLHAPSALAAISTDRQSRHHRHEHEGGHPREAHRHEAGHREHHGPVRGAAPSARSVSRAPRCRTRSSRRPRTTGTTTLPASMIRVGIPYQNTWPSANAPHPLGDDPPARLVHVARALPDLTAQRSGQHPRDTRPGPARDAGRRRRPQRQRHHLRTPHERDSASTAAIRRRASRAHQGAAPSRADACHQAPTDRERETGPAPSQPDRRDGGQTGAAHREPHAEAGGGA